jgi:hypothetical protein
MVLDATGAVGDVIEIRAAIAKRHSSRRIPMHPQLKQNPFSGSFPVCEG